MAISGAMVALYSVMQCLTPVISTILYSNSLATSPSFVGHRRSKMSSSRLNKFRELHMFGRPTCNGSENRGSPPVIELGVTFLGALFLSVVNSALMVKIIDRVKNTCMGQPTLVHPPDIEIITSKL